MEKINGIAASQGISGIAKTFIINENEVNIVKKEISEIDKEIDVLNSSIKEANDQINELKNQAVEKLGEEEAMIFDAHLQILNDPEFLNLVIEKIKSENVNSSWATNEVKNHFFNIFSNMDDEYMKARATDINDVFDRVIKIQEGIEIQDLSKINEDVVIVAYDLTPSQSSQLNPEFVKGFITEIGGKTSHAAIISRTLKIPAIVGVGEKINLIQNNEEIIINGNSGEIFYQPTNELKEKIQEDLINQENFVREVNEFKNKNSISLDGWETKIAANIGSPSDIDETLSNGADGIGLFRTEFLYMDNTNWPTEEEQFQAYKKVLESTRNKVVIRTLDIGGDKKLNYYKFPEELNPFLGYRAIRFQLDNIDNLKTQARALIRASLFGKLAVNIPMISVIDEFMKVKKIFKEIEEELKKENIEFGNYELGIMVESPASVILADKFMEYVDFFSIGSNDLIQYTFAADRMNANVSYLYQPLNPALLRMLKMTIDASHNANKWTAICGEIASYPMLTPILVGMGLDEFSMTPSAIPEIRRLVSKISKKEAEELVTKVLNLSTENEVEKEVISFFESKKIKIS